MSADCEKKRRRNIFDDIPWDKLDIAHTRDATAQRIELYCSEELYIPDCASISLELRSGSCRDLAMLRIEAVRSPGMATRFVSGYLHIPGDEEPHAGGGNTHTRAQIYLPGPGWVDFDPSNGVVGNRDLIRVAVVRDPRQAIPLHGTWRGFSSDYLGMKVDVAVKSVAAESEIATPNLAPRVKSGW